MVDNKFKDDTTTTAASTEVTNLYDTAIQNYIRLVDEFIKAQPQYTQSVSNLQLDYIAASKNTIENMVSTQKVLASNVNFPIVTPQYIDEFVKKSNEITENIVSALRINNQLTVNVINAIAENVRTTNPTKALYIAQHSVTRYESARTIIAIHQLSYSVALKALIANMNRVVR
jgi:hypothetical protein